MALHKTSAGLSRQTAKLALGAVAGVAVAVMRGTIITLIALPMNLWKRYQRNQRNTIAAAM